MKKKSLFASLSIFFIASIHGAEKPNILIFLADDMGLMDTSLPFLTDGKGNPKKYPLNELYRTPNMEKLASRGMRFETFYANSVCSPTRISIMTGQSSARHHTTTWILSEYNNKTPQGPPNWQWEGITKKHQTLPGLLKKDGYHTISIGKGHFGPSKSFGEIPSNFGFDISIGGFSYGRPGSYYGQDGFGWIGGEKKRAIPDLKKYHGKDIYLTEALTIEMNEAIQNAVQKKQPFFAYMAYHAVHKPFMPNKKYAKNYESANISKPAKAFATMIESMDASVGAILQQLDTLGIADNTLVFFLSDNGSVAPLGGKYAIAGSAPLRGKKATHYEGGMRVPFIAAWAKTNPSNPFQQKLPIKAGTITTELGTVQDIFPTLLDTLGVSYKGIIDGENLAPILRGGKIDSQRDFLMHYPHGHYSSYFTVYRQGDWKLIYHYAKSASKRYELFNLIADPGESNNLAQTHPKKLVEMLKAMSTALEDAGAQYPVAKDDPDTLLKPILPEG